MTKQWLILSAALVLPMLPGGGRAQRQDEAAQDGTVQSDEIVVTGMRPDIVVRGRLPRCVRRPGDPLDAVDVSQAPSGVQMMIARDPVTDRFALARDNDPIGGADWQRAGS